MRHTNRDLRNRRRKQKIHKKLRRQAKLQKKAGRKARTPQAGPKAT
jgi:hypothetical protein